MSDSDEAVELFGESMYEGALSVPSPLTRETVPITRSNRFPAVDASSSRIIKLPVSALSVDFSDSSTKKSANMIRARMGESGEIESNTRLVEWEDGSWTLVVGNEHFRVLERNE